MYRHTTRTEPIKCPRCKKVMPPTDPTSCACGTWLSSFAASVLLTERERWQNHATRWWRVREPCPQCNVKMTLCNDEPGLLQGCEVHGYFIDADTVEHTSLAKGIDHAALTKARDDEARVEAHREQQLRDEQERDEERREKEEKERRLGRGLVAALEDDSKRVQNKDQLRANEEQRRVSDRSRREERALALERALLQVPSQVRQAIALLETRVRELETDNRRLEDMVHAMDARLRRIELLS